MWVCQQGVACTIDLICKINFVCTPSIQKPITWICSIAIVKIINNKIEGVVLNRVCILGISFPKQGQGVKPYPPPTPPPPLGLLAFISVSSVISDSNTIIFLFLFWSVNPAWNISALNAKAKRMKIFPRVEPVTSVILKLYTPFRRFVAHK